MMDTELPPVTAAGTALPLADDDVDVVAARLSGPAPTPADVDVRARGGGRRHRAIVLHDAGLC